MNDTRRQFVAASLSAASALAAGSEIPRRPLGKTGLAVSILGLGGAQIGNMDDGAQAATIVKRCFDLGINYFDTAAAGAYGLSQSRYGKALHGLRPRRATGRRHRRNSTSTKASPISAPTTSTFTRSTT